MYIYSYILRRRMRSKDCEEKSRRKQSEGVIGERKQIVEREEKNANHIIYYSTPFIYLFLLLYLLVVT